MSGEFDVERYLAEDYAREVATDLAFEMQLALRCVLSTLFVVVLVIVRYLFLA